MSTSPASPLLHPTVPAWTLGDRLAKARKAAGRSVAEAAEHFEVSTKTIGNYEHDRTQVPRAVVLQWAMWTGFDAGWVEHGIEPDTTDDGPGPASTCIASVAELGASRERRARARTRTVAAARDAA